MSLLSFARDDGARRRSGSAGTTGGQAGSRPRASADTLAQTVSPPRGSTTMSAALTPTPDGFLRHGEPHLVISGAIHYFRVHPEQWRDRLRRLVAMGCNTVETYVAWNIHQPAPGQTT